jgi:dGTPase
LKILDKYPDLREIHQYQSNDFGAIVASASLAHDIGNPPFGHSGEKSIGQFFISEKGKDFSKDLTKKQYQDLCDFEGNANGFKILTQSRIGREGGLRLSYATLGAFVKYPKESLPKRPTKNVSHKKYGFFQSEVDVFNDIAGELGLTKDETESYIRHPLAYLVEAADDICYTIIDFEDGINLGLIEEEFALEYLINLVRDSINTEKYHQLSNTTDRISYLRALSINTLINECVEIFMKNEAEIIQGVFQSSLLDRSKYKAQISDIIKISVENIYESKEVIEKEIAGYNLISVLLESYITAANNMHAGNPNSYDKLILSLLPKTIDLNKPDLYSRILEICHYIASFSDSQALLVYKKITANEY